MEREIVGKIALIIDHGQRGGAERLRHVRRFGAKATVRAPSVHPCHRLYLCRPVIQGLPC